MTLNSALSRKARSGLPRRTGQGRQDWLEGLRTKAKIKIYEERP